MYPSNKAIRWSLKEIKSSIKRKNYKQGKIRIERLNCFLAYQVPRKRYRQYAEALLELTYLSSSFEIFN